MSRFASNQALDPNINWTNPRDQQFDILSGSFLLKCDYLKWEISHLVLPKAKISENSEDTNCSLDSKHHTNLINKISSGKEKDLTLNEKKKKKNQNRRTPQLLRGS